MTAEIVVSFMLTVAGVGQVPPAKRPTVVTVQEIDDAGNVIPGGEAAMARAATLTPMMPLTEEASWFPVQAYPAEARAAGVQGTVAVALDVSDAGLVVGCHIEKTSGSIALDAATCGSAMRNGRFTPATDKGKPIPGTWHIRRVNWQIAGPESLQIPAAGVNIYDDEMEIGLNANGEVTSCRVQSSITSQPDPCRPMTVGRRLVPPLLSDGKPVAGKAHVRSSLRVTAD